jgi:hypothetical protein
MVTFRGLSRFYARNSAGKYQLDVHEIRQAFLLSENITERIRNFRADRISQIDSGNTPVPVGNDAKLILHSIPISSFQSGQLIDIPVTGATYHNFFAEQRFTSRYNLDGILLFFDRGGESIPTEYLQVLRQSQIEYVNGYILGSSLFDTSRTNRISMREVEEETIKIAKSILDYQKSMGVEPPIVISMSLLHVKDSYLTT